ncbi:MAG: hypothetical protein ACRC0X_00310 [Brevinema sp.]
MLASTDGCIFAGGNFFGGSRSYLLEYINGQLVYKAMRIEKCYSWSETPDIITTNFHEFIVYAIGDNTIGVVEENTYHLYGANFGSFTDNYKKINNKTLRSAPTNTFLSKISGTYEITRNNMEKVQIKL